MSGGFFDHKQYNLTWMAQEIELMIRDNLSTETNDYGEPIGRRFSAETIEQFRKGARALREAYAYAQSIDYLASGDTSEDSFQKHLAHELELAKRISEDDPS